MGRGPKKHLKRLNAPRHWMLDKMGGIWAPRPSSGPHKLRECLPLILILRNRLKYALDGREVLQICMRKHILVDGKVRTDPKFPAGFMDVVTIPKANDKFRLLYDIKGRFALHPISDEEAKFKLCKVTGHRIGQKKIPMITTHDGRTIRYPDPIIKTNDTVKIDLDTGKIVDHLKFEVGSLVTVTKGRNTGRIGVLIGREKHDGSFDIAHIKDKSGVQFATRVSSLFAIGKGSTEGPLISMPHNGVKLSILEERAKWEKKQNRR